MVEVLVSASTVTGTGAETNENHIMVGNWWETSCVITEHVVLKLCSPRNTIKLSNKSPAT